MRGVNKVMLVDLYKSGLSITEVSAETGVHASTVRHHLNKEGALRSREEGVRLAGSKGKLGGGMRGKTRVFTDEHRAAMSAAMIERARKHAVGFSVKPSGYVEITRGQHKGRTQHRVIMEQHVGRKLRSDEHVHHIDGNRKNNDISNLEIMTASEHMSHHATKNYQSRRRNKNGTWS